MSGIGRSFVVLSLGQSVSILAGYSTHLVLARQLGAAGYGTYGVLLNVLSTVALILMAGLPESVAKFSAERPDAAPGIIAKAVHLQLIFSIIVAVSFALSSPLLSRALNDSSLSWYFALSALAIPPVALHAIALSVFSGQRRFGAQAVTMGGYGAIRFLLIVFLARSFELRGAVFGFIIAPLIILAVTMPYFYRPKAAVGVDGRALWTFAKPVIVFTVVLNLLLNLDLFVVKAIAQRPEHVGYYTAAGTIARIPYFLFSSLGLVLLPQVASGASETRPVGEVIAGPFRWILMISLLVASSTAPLAPALLSLLYGAEYVWAALPLGLLVISGTLFTQFFILAYALNGAGHPGIPMRLALIGVGLQLVCAVPLVRFFGPSGAAIASCVTGLCLSVGLLWAARTHLGALISGASLARIVSACIVTATVGSTVVESRPVFSLLAIPLGLLFIGALVLMGEVRLRDAMELWNVVRPSNSKQ